MMSTSSSCCCRCVEWCVRTCCPGVVDARKKSPYPGIQYSPVDDVEMQPPDISVSDYERAPRRRVDPPTSRLAETHRRPPRPKMRFALLQDGAHFGVHPQLGVSFGEPDGTVTEQPSPDRFRQRFDLGANAGAINPPVSSLHSGPGLPVYREKSVRLQYGSGDTPDPVIQFSLHYDIHQSKLRVHVQHASDLPRTPVHKGQPVRCDPFVMMHLEPEREDTFQSEVIKNTYNPIFNQMFQFVGLSVDHIRLQTLVLRLYNNALNNRAIGKACLPLRDVDLFGVIMQMKIVQTEEMESNFQGDLLVSLSYSPVSRKLSGVISKATGLRKHDLLGKADPYVKVLVTSKDNDIVFKWKSSIKHNTLAPVYNESFSCTVTEEMNMTMDSITVSFYVIDYDYLLRNDIMGAVIIGNNVESKLGRRHWNEVLRSPRQPISFWHAIQMTTTAHKRHIRLSRSRSPSPFPQ